MSKITEKLIELIDNNLIEQQEYSNLSQREHNHQDSTAYLRSTRMEHQCNQWYHTQEFHSTKYQIHSKYVNTLWQTERTTHPQLQIIFCFHMPTENRT